LIFDVDRNLLIKFFIVLTTNRKTNHEFNLPYRSEYAKPYCRSGASRKSGGTERSGERELQKNDGAERGYRNRFEHGAAFLQLTLRSHALVIIALAAQSVTSDFPGSASTYSLFQLKWALRRTKEKLARFFDTRCKKKCKYTEKPMYRLGHQLNTKSDQ